MGIYIKGMEMPKGCGECPLVEKCKNRHLEIIESDNGYEPIFVQDDCPLIAVPEPHGRLIDVDACIDYIRNNNQQAWEALAYAPIVIESEVEE